MASIRQYAASRGLTAMTVSRGVAKGRLKDSVGRLDNGCPYIADVVLADKEWAASASTWVAPPGLVRAPGGPTADRLRHGHRHGSTPFHEMIREMTDDGEEVAVFFRAVMRGEVWMKIGETLIPPTISERLEAACELRNSGWGRPTVTTNLTITAVQAARFDPSRIGDDDKLRSMLETMELGMLSQDASGEPEEDDGEDDGEVVVNEAASADGG